MPLYKKYMGPLMTFEVMGCFMLVISITFVQKTRED